MGIIKKASLAAATAEQDANEKIFQEQDSTGTEEMQEFSIKDLLSACVGHKESCESCPAIEYCNRFLGSHGIEPRMVSEEVISNVEV